MLTFSLATDDDFDAIWPIFHAVVQSGTTYVYAPTTSKESAHTIWMEQPRQTYIARNAENKVVGTYYIQENRPDLGNHICRCGFMVSPDFRKQGVGQALCEHSLVTALTLGFRAMQFSYVVSTNHAAIRLWLKMGFTHIGTVPNGFRHAVLGYVDIWIMYKSLTDS
jgi:L-amino acid N-acyltransferase YncA